MPQNVCYGIIKFHASASLEAVCVLYPLQKFIFQSIINAHIHPIVSHFITNNIAKVFNNFVWNNIKFVALSSLNYMQTVRNILLNALTTLHIFKKYCKFFCLVLKF